jgi:hypothetical protein
MKSGKRLGRIALTVFTIRWTPLVGCTSTTSGQAVRAPADPDDPIVALLDTGNYPATAARQVAKCFTRSDWVPNPNTSFRQTSVQLLWRVKCFAAVDRYVFTSASEEEKDAKQQISAQYQFLRPIDAEGLGADAGPWALC